MVVEDLRTLNDDDVVMLVRAGETGLYELLMRRYNQRLFRLIRSVISNPQEAEDVLQDAWVRAYEHLDQFAGRASFSTWVCRIAFYEALGRMRKARRVTPLEDDDPKVLAAGSGGTRVGTPEEQMMSDELGRLIESSVDRLPEVYRSVFVLREVEGMSTAETADALELSEEAVKTRLHRSRALLRRDLEGRLGTTFKSAYAFMGNRCDRMVAHVLARIGAREDTAGRR